MALATAADSGRATLDQAADKMAATVVDLAIANPDFNVLVATLLAAGLRDALSSSGSEFTVFAPTDSAFVALLSELGSTAEELIARPDLESILRYHVIVGKLLRKDLFDGQEIETMEGRKLSVTISKDGIVKIDEATVLQANLMAGNGVVHVIHAVLLPKPPKPMPATVLEAIQADRDLTTLVAAVTANSLVDDLTSYGPYTLFAPTNAAFDALAKSLDVYRADLLAHPDLFGILVYHVISRKVMSRNLSNGQEIRTILGGRINVSIGKDNIVKINDSLVLKADIEASNGVVHVIDAVLVP